MLSALYCLLSSFSAGSGHGQSHPGQTGKGVHDTARKVAQIMPKFVIDK